MNLKKYKNKLIISKDAGAANMIFNYLKSSKNYFYCYLKNPAKKIFKHKNFIKLRNIKNLKKYDLLITGTSVENKLELDNIQAAKKLGIHTVTFLDHWTNYKKRFLLKNKFIIPDEIIAFDSNSFSLARNIFSKQILKKTLTLNKINNNYFKIIHNKKKNDLLVLSSNYDSLKNHTINDNKILFNFFKKNYFFLKSKKINKYYLKYHPSENKSKFIPLVKKLKNEFNIDIKITDKDLKKITKLTKYVVGYNSMAIVIAKLSGCITYEIKIKQLKSDIPSNYIDNYI
jgi:hypothetical protein